MTNKLEIINPLEYGKWDDLVLSTNDYCFFHSSAWARILVETYGYRPVYFAAVENDKLVAAIPIMEIKSLITGRRGVSLPFSDYCNSIIDDNIPRRDILDQIIGYAKKSGWKSIGFRGNPVYEEEISPSSSCYKHTVDLSEGEEKVFANFKSSVRRNIKKAEQQELRLDICHSVDSVKRFYHLQCRTRKRHGLPPQPYTLFKNIHKHILSNDAGFVILASDKGTTIAGAVFFHYGRTGTYKYGASDMIYQHLRPNELIMWEAMKWYTQNGFTSLSLGKSEPQNEGLRRYKSGLGGREETVKYYKYDVACESFVKEHSKTRGFHNRIFRVLPIPVLKIAGRLLYKHVG